MTPTKWGHLGCSLHPSTELEGIKTPTLGLLQLPELWAKNSPHSESRNSHRPGQGRGVHPCVWALAAFGTPPPGVESPWADSGGSPLPAVLPAPVPVPQLASVGGEFLPLSFLAPIGRCHLGSVGRQARRWPWGGRW